MSVRKKINMGFSGSIIKMKNEKTANIIKKGKYAHEKIKENCKGLCNSNI